MWFIWIYIFNNFAGQAGRAPQQPTPIIVGPFTLPTTMKTEESEPQHRELHALLFSNRVWVFYGPTFIYFFLRNGKYYETASTVYSPYPRRLESLTICWCNYKGNPFSSVILRIWVLVPPELNSRPPAWQPDAQPTQCACLMCGARTWDMCGARWCYSKNPLVSPPTEKLM